MANQNKRVKKLSKVGQGIAVFLTQEAVRLNWKQGDYVAVEVVEEGKNSRLVLKRIDI